MDTTATPHPARLAAYAPPCPGGGPDCDRIAYPLDAQVRRRKRMSTLTITRIAHSSVLIAIDGHAILTDPWYSERPGYYHGEPYGITLDDLPRLDGVAVTTTMITTIWKASLRILTKTCRSRSG